MSGPPNEFFEFFFIKRNFYRFFIRFRPLSYGELFIVILSKFRVERVVDGEFEGTGSALFDHAIESGSVISPKFTSVNIGSTLDIRLCQNV